MMAKKASNGKKGTSKSLTAPAGTVIFYEAIGGAGKSFSINRGINNLLHYTGTEGQGKGFWNDRISGIVVGQGVTCTIYVHRNKGSDAAHPPITLTPGNYLNFWNDPNHPELRKYDHKISSFDIT